MRGPYETPDEPCPYCGEMCSAEFVDVGVGMVQCSPYYCHGCRAIEMGPGTTPDRPLTEDEKRTGWTIEEQSPLTPLQQRTRSAFADVLSESFMDASSHNYRCKCASCLQWWVAMGRDDTGNGWTAGPFSDEEFNSAGGAVPEIQ